MMESSQKLKKAINALGIDLYLPDTGLLYKYTSFDTAIKIIEGNCLRFSNPDEFNDPFDMINFLIDKSCTEHELQEWVERVAHAKDQQRKMEIKEYLSDPIKLNELFDQALNSIKREAGISCFSKTYTQTLMWSHYANKHSGVCLGFNFRPTSELDNLLIMSVRYVDKIDRLNLFKDRDIILFHWVFTKSHVWSYEEEVRAIISNRIGLVPFEKQCLKEIYFGLKTTTDQKKQIADLISVRNYADVKVSSMTIDANTFALAEAK